MNELTKKLLSSLKELVPKVIRDFFRGGDGIALITALGTVTAVVGGKPQVRFDKEDTASGMAYPYLSQYVPTVSDRVLLLRVGNGWVVLGKVINS